MNQRKEFLQYFFTAIRDDRYALLKFIYSSIDAIPESSDVDLVVEKQYRTEFLHIIRGGNNIKKIHVYNKSYVTFVSILFEDESYLELDLLHRIERKGIIFLQTNELISQANTNAENIYVVSLSHNFEYIVLFYLLNGSSVPQKYIDYFTTLSADQRSEIFAHISEKHTVHLNVLDELFHRSERNSRKIVREIYQLSINKKINYLFHKIRYATDVIREMMFNRGVIITFSGVDGAGKSTVIKHVDKILQNKYRQKTVVIRHRPGIFPILSAIKYGKKEAEKRTTQQLPRQGKNEGTVNSFFRFLYYYTDYFFGQFYVLFKYTLKGTTVLYDRYYFDFIIDAKRSNIVLQKNIFKSVYFFLIKPNLNIFLYAPAEIILERKMELEKEDIQQLTKEYQLLFEEYKKTYKKQQYISINNLRLESTTGIVINNYLSAAFR